MSDTSWWKEGLMTTGLVVSMGTDLAGVAQNVAEPFLDQTHETTISQEVHPESSQFADRVAELNEQELGSQLVDKLSELNEQQLDQEVGQLGDVYADQKLEQAGHEKATLGEPEVVGDVFTDAGMDGGGSRGMLG